MPDTPGRSNLLKELELKFAVEDFYSWMSANLDNNRIVEFKMHYDGHTDKEIADRVGITIENIKLRRFRVRKAFKKHLKNQGQRLKKKSQAKMVSKISLPNT